jgi:hypothetical protein
LVYLLFALTFVATTSSLGESITFTFANRTITGTSPKFLEFDVMVAGGTGGTRIGDTQVYINYNTLGFGSSIQTSGKITATKGSLISSATYDMPVLNDNTTSRISIQVSYQGSTGNGASLPTSSSQLLHIKIEIADQSQAAGLSFEQSLMAGQQVQDDNSTVYSPLTASDGDNGPLPVELSSFTASINQNVANLIWKTKTEVNNYGFEVERKVESREYGAGKFEKIGFVSGSGNSNSPKDYSFLDKNPSGGSRFLYRLKQVDNNGKFTYSDEVELELVPAKFELFQNYPNPFNPSTNIKFAVPKAGNISLSVYSILGEKVKDLISGFYEPGIYNLEFNAKDLGSGTYFYRLQGENFVQVKKMLLVK